MSYRITSIEKLSAVKDYLEGKESQGYIATRLNVSKTSVQQWIRNFESLGSDAFLMKGKKKCSRELKLQAVEDYITGHGSQTDICKKYGIR